MMLKYSFYLSQWFAGKKKDKVVSGTVFLFLNQLGFLFGAVFLLINKLLPFNLSPEMFTGIGMLAVLFIMYGLEKKVKRQIIQNKYEILEVDKIYQTRFIALLLSVFPFILCFLILILFYR